MQNNVYSQNIPNIYIDHKYLLIYYGFIVNERESAKEINNDLRIYFQVVPIVLKITIII